MLKDLSKNLIPRLMEFTAKHLGPEVFVEGWDEFFDGSGEEFREDHPLVPIVFPWIFYSWFTEDGLNPASEFLSANLKKLNLKEIQYLSGCLESTFTFYKITQAIPSQSIDVIDLMTKKEMTIWEVTGSKQLKKDDILFAKPVTIDGKNFLDSCAPIIIPTSYLLHIVKFSQLPKRETKDELNRIDLFLGIYEHSMNPQKPVLTNTDGHLLSLRKLIFEIESPHLAFKALSGLCLSETEKQLLEFAKLDQKGEVIEIDFPWLNKKNTVLGKITIKKTNLTVEVNSVERMEAFLKLIRKLMPKAYSLKETVVESMDEATTPTQKSLNPADHPELQKILEKKMADHWDDWIKMKIPALGNVTPLKAMTTVKGRELLNVLITDFERSAIERPLFGQNLETFKTLRKKLGLN